MSRTELFRRRLLPSLLALLAVFAAVRLLWFPGAYFQLAGVSRLLLVMLAVNLVIGPGLTTLVYKPGKPGMRFDIWALAVVECAALGAGAWALYARQPAYTVFAVDRFEVVTRAEVDTSSLADARLRSRPGFGPRLVYARMPMEPEAHAELIDDVLFRGLADIERRPEFWQAYPAGIPALKARATPLDQAIDGSGERAQRFRQWLDDRDARPGAFVFLPLRGRTADAAIIVHADIGYPVDILLVDPW